MVLLVSSELPVDHCYCFCLIFQGVMDVDTCIARLARVMDDNEPALVAARAERYIGFS